MRKVAELVSWARRHADEVQKDMQWTSGEYGAWWAADSPQKKARIAGRATAALEFLRRYAGCQSEWAQRAQRYYASGGDNQSMETGAHALGDLLREWARQVEDGIIDVPGSLAAAEYEVASTDLMLQVRNLLQDRAVHPVAPIVLAGAALEVALRAAVSEKSLELTERPSITAYARRLRQEGVLTAQHQKDVEQLSGMRNLAAHGEFDTLSRERANLMEQQVNFFLAQLREILDS